MIRLHYIRRQMGGVRVTTGRAACSWNWAGGRLESRQRTCAGRWSKSHELGAREILLKHRRRCGPRANPRQCSRLAEPNAVTEAAPFEYV